MSLDWNIENVENWKEVCYPIKDESGEEVDRHIDPILNLLIWSSLAVDLGRIEEENIDEWLWRCSFLARIGASMGERAIKDENGNTLLRENGRPIYEPFVPTVDELRRFCGLHTNVAKQSRNKFVRRWIDTIKANISTSVDIALNEDRIKREGLDQDPEQFEQVGHQTVVIQGE